MSDEEEVALDEEHQEGTNYEAELALDAKHRKELSEPIFVRREVAFRHEAAEFEWTNLLYLIRLTPLTERRGGELVLTATGFPENNLNPLNSLTIEGLPRDRELLHQVELVLRKRLEREGLLGNLTVTSQTYEFELTGRQCSRLYGIFQQYADRLDDTRRKVQLLVCGEDIQRDQDIELDRDEIRARCQRVQQEFFANKVLDDSQREDALAGFELGMEHQLHGVEANHPLVQVRTWYFGALLDAAASFVFFCFKSIYSPFFFLLNTIHLHLSDSVGILFGHYGQHFGDHIFCVDSTAALWGVQVSVVGLGNVNLYFMVWNYCRGVTSMLVDSVLGVEVAPSEGQVVLILTTLPTL